MATRKPGKSGASGASGTSGTSGTPKPSDKGKDAAPTPKEAQAAAAAAATAAQAVANVRPDPVIMEVPAPVLGTMPITALDDPRSERGDDGRAIAAEDAVPATGDTVALTDSNMVAAEFQERLLDNARDVESEVGTTGLKGAEPYGGWLYEEAIPVLRGLSGARFFKQMYDEDAMCGAVIFALKTLMKRVTWRVDAKNTSHEAQLAQERVQAMLFEDMAHPFGQLIDEACSMLVYGYAPHEIIWKRCKGEGNDPLHTSQFDDGAWAPAALPIRSQETVWRWIFDTQGRGNIIGFEQMRLGFQNAIIPSAKALIFRTESARNNPEGRSLLRNAYKPYLRKNVIEEAEARLALRSAGMVIVRIPGTLMEYGTAGVEAQIFNYYKRMADQSAQDRQGSAVMSSDRDDKGNLKYEVDYLQSDSRELKDFDPIIQRYNSSIAISVLADFLLLGTQKVGSWALADTKTSLFVLATEAMLGVIAEELNRVLLRKVWRLNGWDMQLIPMIKPGAVQKADLAAIGPFLQQMSAAGAPLFPSRDNKLEQWILEQAGAPNLTTAVG